MGQAAGPDPAQRQYLFEHRVALTEVTATGQPIDHLPESSRQVDDIANRAGGLRPEQEGGAGPQPPNGAVAVRVRRLAIGESTHSEGGPSKPFFRDADMRDLYQQHTLDNGPDFAADREIEADHLWYDFHSLTTSGLADLNGLSIDENRALFASSAIPTAIELVLVGLGRIRRRRLPQ